MAFTTLHGDLLPNFSIATELRLLEQKSLAKPNPSHPPSLDSSAIDNVLKGMNSFSEWRMNPLNKNQAVPDFLQSNLDKLMHQWYYLLQNSPPSVMPLTTLTTQLTRADQLNIYKSFLLNIQDYIIKHIQKPTEEKSPVGKRIESEKKLNEEKAQYLVVHLEKFLDHYSLINPQQQQGDLYPIQLQSLEIQIRYFRLWTEWVLNKLTQDHDLAKEMAALNSLSFIMKWAALVWLQALSVRQVKFDVVADFAGQWLYFLKSYVNQPWSVIEQEIPDINEIKKRIATISTTAFANLENEATAAYTLHRQMLDKKFQEEQEQERERKIKIQEDEDDAKAALDEILQTKRAAQAKQAAAAAKLEAAKAERKAAQERARRAAEAKAEAERRAAQERARRAAEAKAKAEAERKAAQERARRAAADADAQEQAARERKRHEERNKYRSEAKGGPRGSFFGFSGQGFGQRENRWGSSSYYYAEDRGGRGAESFGGVGGGRYWGANPEPKAAAMPEKDAKLLFDSINNEIRDSPGMYKLVKNMLSLALHPDRACKSDNNMLTKEAVLNVNQELLSKLLAKISDANKADRLRKLITSILELHTPNVENPENCANLFKIFNQEFL